MPHLNDPSRILTSLASMSLLIGLCLGCGDFVQPKTFKFTAHLNNQSDFGLGLQFFAGDEINNANGCDPVAGNKAGGMGPRQRTTLSEQIKCDEPEGLEPRIAYTLYGENREVIASGSQEGRTIILDCSNDGCTVTEPE